MTNAPFFFRSDLISVGRIASAPPELIRVDKKRVPDNFKRKQNVPGVWRQVYGIVDDVFADLLDVSCHSHPVTPRMLEVEAGVPIPGDEHAKEMVKLLYFSSGKGSCFTREFT